MKTKFHKYLSLFRKELGYTQAQMAEKLNIPRSTYTNYETGNRSPDLEMLERISEVLNCSLDELFGRAPVSASAVIQEEQAPYTVNPPKPQTARRKKLAIGMQDFRHMREKDAYYVDKTHMIEEFLESEYQITLITRPRRFGKTLNMSMLAEFLDCTKQSREIFAETKVEDSYVMREINEHPVLFVSFLDVKGDTADVMLYQLGRVLRNEYKRYSSILSDGTLTNMQKQEFDNIYECLWHEKDAEELGKCISSSIVTLCDTLELYYQKKVYLLIDEYDTPFIAANAGGYYNDVRSILARMLSSSLKGNPSLEKAMLTGILRVAKENIFSGLNNLAVCTVKDSDYSDCFGFTEDETKAVLLNYGVPFTEEIKKMYDGYLFGSTEVYNPWSVACYAVRKELEPYWVNTSENSILKDALAQRGESFAKMYRKLIETGSICADVELTAAYYEQPDDASLWGLLINAGMVTIQKILDENFYQLRIPNYEVRKAFQDLTAFYLKLEEGHITAMLRNLRTESMEEFSEDYQAILLVLPSYYDLKDENSYHMMMLGMCAFMYRHYDVKSNRESGTGRGDILLYAKNPELSNMILEFKYTKDESQNLEELAYEAIEQVKEKKYDAGMNGQVYCIGLAHCGKKAEVRWEKTR